MSMKRRTALKCLATGAAMASGVSTAAASRTPVEAPEKALGMLYDATKCIGCKACVAACKRANDMPTENTLTSDDIPASMYDAPKDLSSKTRNIIKFCQEDGAESFMKMQCMHCLDPACASVCMIQAFSKDEHGIVTYDPDRCIGCRYCQVACPFNVPKFQWDEAAPVIVKCELCRHRFADGKGPACCEVCPRGAVIFGDYRELLAEAHRRLETNPDRYEPKVYGEFDGGGTQVLYLSAKGFGFDQLGLPALSDEPVPHMSVTIQHGIYKGFIAPAALYAALGLVLLRNRKSNENLRLEPPDGPAAGGKEDRP